MILTSASFLVCVLQGMGGEKGIPVLYLNDGVNLYEDWLAHQVRKG